MTANADQGNASVGVGCGQAALAVRQPCFLKMPTLATAKSPEF
jgi:hypothetical protein